MSRRSQVNLISVRGAWVARFMVGALVAIVGTVSASGVSVAMPALAVDRTVYPTGQYPTDVQNVQAAIDQGGSILLKATNAAGAPTAFNFGPSELGSGFVQLNGTVALLGETVSDSARTTVTGGWGPLITFANANVTIGGIDFERPFEEAILLFDPASAKVVNNRVAHVVGRPFRPGVTFGDGILIDGGGTITIADNVIEDVDAALGEGIAQSFARGAVEIARNRVSGTNTIAIESGPAGPGGAVRITNNTLLPGPQRYPRFAAGAAIEVNGGGAYAVTGNTATCVNPNADCIVAVGRSDLGDFAPLVGPVIERNHVFAQSDGILGISLIGQVSNAYVGQNQVEGNGTVALAMFAQLVTSSDLASPTFVGNNIARFSASFADVFFDIPTHDAVLVGVSGKVVDLGTNDRITGFTPIGDKQNIGRQISQAMALRNQEIQEAKSTMPADRRATR